MFDKDFHHPMLPTSRTERWRKYDNISRYK